MEFGRRRENAREDFIMPLFDQGEIVGMDKPEFGAWCWKVRIRQSFGINVVLGFFDWELRKTIKPIAPKLRIIKEGECPKEKVFSQYDCFPTFRKIIKYIKTIMR
jgi:hypothetical protein